MNARTRILLVDDEPSIRKVYQQALETGTTEVVTAADAQEACSLMDDGPFDAILLDLRLPQEDGLALLARIRARWPSVPVAIVTAYGDVPAAVEAMRRGARDFVIKPSRPDALRALVERLIHDSEATPGAAEYGETIDAAVSEARAGHLEQAWSKARLALAIEPSRPEALHVLALLVQRRGERLEAQAFLRAALALDPTYAPARAELDRLTTYGSRGDVAWPPAMRGSGRS